MQRNTNNSSSITSSQTKTVAANIASDIDNFSSQLRIKQNQHDLYIQQLHQLESSIQKVNQKIADMLSKSKSSVTSNNTTDSDSNTNSSVSDNKTLSSSSLSPTITIYSSFEKI